MVSVKGVAAFVLRALLVAMFGWWAYTIRQHAINVYGRVIHEFDPWFNFRATQYLADNGWTKFFHWFDYEAWYPLGRPVGTTIYPGMQIASVALWNGINAFGIEMSLNDVCVFVPTWFAVAATCFLGLLAAECSGNSNVGVAAAGIMSIIPAHLMRSIGGGYDNESVAMTAMCATFYFWCRSLRGGRSYWWGILTGLSYVFMVAAWGGYVFVLNMIGVHAMGLVLLGRYSSKLHRAYSLFLIIGTLGAIQIPVVGLAPLKSLEQLGPMAVFFVLQALAVCDYYSTSRGHDAQQRRQTIGTAFTVLAALGGVVVAILFPTGYFGPLSSRVRGLFVSHTHTGNPLVDSVAEHQPASADAYYQNLHYIYYAAPIGFIISLFNRSDANLFLVFYAIVAYYFSSKMARLIILLGPIASCLGGVALWYGITWAAEQMAMIPKLASGVDDEDTEEDEAEPSSKDGKDGKKGGKKGKKGGKSGTKRAKNAPHEGSLETLLPKLKETYNAKSSRVPRVLGACLVAAMTVYGCFMFYNYSHYMAQAISQPMVMFQARTQSGEVIMVDDYREAYWWLRDNTPEDSRVMAWWDYGYQINGIANRTSIADGNTWNHEHIATLARCLTSPVKQAHRMIRHLADYVLVWAGGGGDDLAKSPHMARIGTSVYAQICGGDKSCSKFGFVDRQGTPTPMMRRSLLYNLHSHNIVPGVHVDENRFREVYTSKYGKVRIFQVMSVSKKSKRWVANPKNRLCDAPGSWYCTGQYPPALNKVFKSKQDFKQLEDFNA